MTTPAVNEEKEESGGTQPDSSKRSRIYQEMIDSKRINDSPIAILGDERGEAIVQQHVSHNDTVTTANAATSVRPQAAAGRDHGGMIYNTMLHSKLLNDSPIAISREPDKVGNTTEPGHVNETALLATSQSNSHDPPQLPAAGNKKSGLCLAKNDTAVDLGGMTPVARCRPVALDDSMTDGGDAPIVLYDANGQVVFQALASYPLSSRAVLTVAKGSISDFIPGRRTKAAIVNATDEVCSGSGGGDGAVSAAGGPNLAQDRRQLPVVSRMAVDGAPIRCPTGSAVLTGPNSYGALQVPYVIHAVGPRYQDYDENIDEEIAQAHALLASAYESSLQLASQEGIVAVGFALLCTGYRRAKMPLSVVLTVGVLAIQKFFQSLTSSSASSLQHVCLCAFTNEECAVLQQVCHQLLDQQTKESHVVAPQDAEDDGETGTTDRRVQDDVPFDSEPSSSQEHVVEDAGREKQPVVPSAAADAAPSPMARRVDEPLQRSRCLSCIVQ